MPPIDGLHQRPAGVADIEVTLTADEMDQLRRLAASEKFGETEAEVLRYVFFTWWIGKFMRGPNTARRSPCTSPPSVRAR